MISPSKAAAFFIAGVFIAFPGADTFLKYEKTTDAYEIMKQKVPAKTTQSVMWIRGDKARCDDGEGHTAIFDAKTKTAFFINHAEKTYGTFSLGGGKGMMEQAVEQGAEDEEQAAQMKKMMKGMGAMLQMEAKVTASNEKKKIGQWACNRWNVQITMAGIPSTSVIWACENIKVDGEWMDAVRNFAMYGQEGFDKMLAEMKKIKGVPVLTTASSEAMGAHVKYTEKLLEHAEKPAPAGSYEVPKGYQKR